MVAGLGSPDLGSACLSEASSWHGWLWSPGCLKAGIRSQGSCFGAQSVSELSLIFSCWWVCQGLARWKLAAGVGGRVSPVTSACWWESWGPRDPKGSASQLVGWRQVPGSWSWCAPTSRARCWGECWPTGRQSWVLGSLAIGSRGPRASVGLLVDRPTWPPSEWYCDPTWLAAGPEASQYWCSQAVGWASQYWCSQAGGQGIPALVLTGWWAGHPSTVLTGWWAGHPSTVLTSWWAGHPSTVLTGWWAGPGPCTSKPEGGFQNGARGRTSSTE